MSKTLWDTAIDRVYGKLPNPEVILTLKVGREFKELFRRECVKAETDMSRVARELIGDWLVKQTNGRIKKVEEAGDNGQDQDS